LSVDENVGTATEATVKGLSNNAQYYMAVTAVNGSSESLPSAEKGVIQLAAGSPGPIAMWDFSGRQGNEAAGDVFPTSGRVSVGPISRGKGLLPSAADWAKGMRQNHFASEAAGNLYAQSADEAVEKEQYYQFTLAPSAGQVLSLNSVAAAVFSQNGKGQLAIAWSRDGKSFGKPIPMTEESGVWQADLSKVAEVKNLGGKLTIRLYTYGVGPYQLQSLGGKAGQDILVTGSITPSK
jgi:hypothetical protein